LLSFSFFPVSFFFFLSSSQSLLGPMVNHSFMPSLSLFSIYLSRGEAVSSWRHSAGWASGVRRGGLPARAWGGGSGGRGSGMRRRVVWLERAVMNGGFSAWRRGSGVRRLERPAGRATGVGGRRRLRFMAAWATGVGGRQHEVVDRCSRTTMSHFRSTIPY
jgi:hypothetical protein